VKIFGEFVRGNVCVFEVVCGLEVRVRRSEIVMMGREGVVEVEVEGGDAG